MAGNPIREMRLEVNPGLYVLRYVNSADLRTAPSAVVRSVMSSAGAIEIISVPGKMPGELDGPGSSVVVVASAAGAIEIAITAFQDAQNLDARFSLDLLGAAEASRSRSQSRPVQATVPRSPGMRGAEVGLDLLAHVSRRGDVTADEEGWIAGARAPSAIEAVQLRVRGADVGVAAQFRNVETRSSWSPWSTPGAVIGVPRRACPLTGIRLKLVGPEAHRFEILGEALFLGAPKASAKGEEIEFVAPGELDPLIGLKLTLAERVAQAATPSSEKPSRVRVFR